MQSSSLSLIAASSYVRFLDRTISFLDAQRHCSMGYRFLHSSASKSHLGGHIERPNAMKFLDTEFVPHTFVSSKERGYRSPAPLTRGANLPRCVRYRISSSQVMHS